MPRSSIRRSRAAASRRWIRAAAEAAPGVALVMTHRNAPRMKPPQAFGEGDGVAGSNLPDHAGRVHPLERRGGGRGAGRNAGAGRPRGRARFGDLHPRGGRHRLRGRAGRAGARSGQRARRALRDRDRRCRKSAGRGPSPGRRDLHDADPEPQRHRAARRHRRLAGRPASRARRHPDDHQHGGLARPGVRAEARRRCACSRRSSAAGSAARACGATRSWPPPRRSWPAGRCGWC